MMWDFVVKIEQAKAAIGKMQINLPRQPALRAQTIAVTDDQRPDHQFGVNRRPADLATMELQPFVNARQAPPSKSC